MKKLLAAILLVTLLVSLTGCFAVRVTKPEEPLPQKETPSFRETRSGDADRTPPTADPEVTLTEEEAWSIALTHAGIAPEDAQRLRCKRDRDDGLWVYEVEFHDGKYEYEYEIHADTGDILSADRDRLGD